MNEINDAESKVKLNRYGNYIWQRDLLLTITQWVVCIPRWVLRNINYINLKK